MALRHNIQQSVSTFSTLFITLSERKKRRKSFQISIFTSDESIQQISSSVKTRSIAHHFRFSVQPEGRFRLRISEA